MSQLKLCNRVQRKRKEKKIDDEGPLKYRQNCSSNGGGSSVDPSRTDFLPNVVIPLFSSGSLKFQTEPLIVSKDVIYM